MKKQFNRLLLTTSLTAATLFCGGNGTAHAQNGNNKDKKSFIEALKPQSVSVTFMCRHWGGPEYKSLGDNLGSFSAPADYNTVPEQAVKYLIAQQEWVADIYKNAYLYDPPVPDGTNMTSDEYAQSVADAAEKNIAYLKSLQASGDYSDLHFSEQKKVNAAGKEYKDINVNKIDRHKYNENANFGILLHHHLTDLNEPGTLSLKSTVGAFRNSYYNWSGLAALTVNKEEILKTKNLGVSFSAGIVSGYTPYQVGKTAYLGGGLSAIVAGDVHWTTKHGITVGLQVSPVYGTFTLGKTFGKPKPSGP